MAAAEREIRDGDRKKKYDDINISTISQEYSKNLLTFGWMDVFLVSNLFCDYWALNEEKYW